jgi:hypothetical protein
MDVESTCAQLTGGEFNIYKIYLLTFHHVTSSFCSTNLAQLRTALTMDPIGDYQIYAYSLNAWVKKWNPVGITPPHETIMQRIDMAFRQKSVSFSF